MALIQVTLRQSVPDYSDHHVGDDRGIMHGSSEHLIRPKSTTQQTIWRSDVHLTRLVVAATDILALAPRATDQTTTSNH